MQTNDTNWEPKPFRLIDACEQVHGFNDLIKSIRNQYMIIERT